jgi:hypothetical protein
MRLFFIERPSAPPAALVQVVAAPVCTAPARVSVVGSRAVQTRTINGAPQLPVWMQQAAASRNESGLASRGIDRRKYGIAGASGVPPRGRPV